jgi:hypothetical protein
MGQWAELLPLLGESLCSPLPSPSVSGHPICFWTCFPLTRSQSSSVQDTVFRVSRPCLAKRQAGRLDFEGSLDTDAGATTKDRDDPFCTYLDPGFDFDTRPCLALRAWLGCVLRLGFSHVLLLYLKS